MGDTCAQHIRTIFVAAADNCHEAGIYAIASPPRAGFPMRMTGNNENIVEDMLTRVNSGRYVCPASNWALATSLSLILADELDLSYDNFTMPHSLNSTHRACVVGLITSRSPSNSCIAWLKHMVSIVSLLHQMVDGCTACIHSVSSCSLGVRTSASS